MYCLDTDVASAVLGRSPRLDVVRRLAQVPPAEQFTTAITLAELLYGAHKRDSPTLLERIREWALQGVGILPFDEVAARTYGPLRTKLESQGRPLDQSDLQIASIALAYDMTLVTGNVRHFARVPGLRVENWLAG